MHTIIILSSFQYTMTRTSAMNRMRRRSGATALILLLSLQSSLLLQDVSSLQPSTRSALSRITSGRAFGNSPSFLSTTGGVVGRPMNATSTIPSFSTKLYSSHQSQRTTTTTTTYNAEDVVELQYSEFLPPSDESSHPPVM